MLILANDRFELRRLVGEGSYGEVYEAIDRQTEQRVAVKVMLHAGRGAAGRFEREAQLLAELQHPSIVRYIAHGQTKNGQSYLVMEWLEGETLEQRLRQRQMATEEVIALALAVVNGLMFAATKGIVHRDIKPANLYLVGHAAAAAKILDLGLARRHEHDQRLTRTGALVGTPLYMSPEQARGAHDVDPRSDVFSLGSVLYECLCIDRPFEGAHPLATLAKICMEEPVPVELNAPQAPPRLAVLVHAMLHKDRERRPGYRWLALELAAIASGVPASTSSPQARTLRSQGEQRVLCAVFVRGVRSEGTDQLAVVAQQLGARRESLLDGSQILLIEEQANALDQALSSARCALALRALLAEAPIAVCTGKARVAAGGPLLGELLERGVALLLQTPAGTIRVDADSAALLSARFELAHDRLLREQPSGESPRTLLGQPTRFVGRDRELAQLTLAFRECSEEQVARPVLVTAPPGAGKSRLRHELVESLRGQAFTMLVARGDAMRTGTQFGMLRSALQSWLGADDEPREKLRMMLAALAPPGRLAMLTVFLGELLGMTFPDVHDPQVTAARRDPALMAERVQESFQEWLRALCQRSPVIFCVEDLHWSDPASVRVLDHALGALAQRPLLVLALARPELRECFPNLWSERGLTELRLPKLTARSCERVLEAALPQLDSDQRRSLIERADGNPFFLEELVRALSAGETDLPATVLGVVQARLDHLGDELKQVIRAASVYGAQFSAAGVRALLDLAGDLDASLRLLVEREVLCAPESNQYAFRHALIQDAAYLLLDRELRESAHRAAAAWLGEHGASAAVLGEHWERGALPESAAPCYSRAALEAFEAGSLEQSLRWGERALACGASGTVLGEAAAVMALASSYLLRDDAALHMSELALSLLRADNPAWWRAAQVACITPLRLARMPAAETAFLRVASELPDSPTMPEQIGLLSFVVAEACRVLHRGLCERALALLPDADTMSGRAKGYACNALSFRAELLGKKDDVLRHARAAVEAFRSVGANVELVEALGNAGYHLYEVGAFDEAEWAFLEKHQISQASGPPIDRAYGAFYLGQLQVRRGQLQDAEPLLVQSVRLHDEGHAASHQQETRAALAELRLLRGELGSAEQLLEEALHVHSELHPPALATVYLAYAKLELARGEGQRALVQIERAVALMDEHGGRIDAGGRIRPVHVECLLACGRTAEARAASQRANSWLDTQLLRFEDAGLRAGYLQLAENQRIRALAELT